MSYKITGRTVDYLGNSNTKEVHDLRNEKTGCQISTILANEHAVGFIPDSITQAKSENYDACAHCLPGQSKR